MVGGKVIETIVLDDRVWVNCQEYLKTQDRLLRDTCAIYVEKTDKSRSISEGDIVWWQGDSAMWTPKNSSGETYGKTDIRLKRIGFSGVNRPTNQPK